jgi:biopolymer transport protein ExbD
MRIKRRTELKKTRIEIIPMIDTMFFLLVFFILASLQVIDLKGKRVNLPNAHNQDRQTSPNLSLTIQPDGKVAINQNPPLAEGQDVGETMLAELKKNDTPAKTVRPEDAVVVINADRRATYAMVRACMDSARTKRFAKFSIATQPITQAKTN